MLLLLLPDWRQSQCVRSAGQFYCHSSSPLEPKGVPKGCGQRELAPAQSSASGQKGGSLGQKGECGEMLFFFLSLSLSVASQFAWPKCAANSRHSSPICAPGPKNEPRQENNKSSGRKKAEVGPEGALTLRSLRPMSNNFMYDYYWRAGQFAAFIVISLHVCPKTARKTASNYSLLSPSVRRLFKGTVRPEARRGGGQTGTTFALVQPLSSGPSCVGLRDVCRTLSHLLHGPNSKHSPVHSSCARIERVRLALAGCPLVSRPRESQTRPRP